MAEGELGEGLLWGPSSHLHSLWECQDSHANITGGGDRTTFSARGHLQHVPWSWEGLSVELSCPDHGLVVSCFAEFQALIAWRPWRRCQGYLGPGKTPRDSSGCPH